MTSNIIKFPDFLKGNGAREALIEVLDCEAEKADGENDLLLVDRMLGHLWIMGFKIVPIEDEAK